MRLSPRQLEMLHDALLGGASGATYLADRHAVSVANRLEEAGLGVVIWRNAVRQFCIEGCNSTLTDVY